VDVRRVSCADFDMDGIGRTTKYPESGDFKPQLNLKKINPPKQ